MPPSRLPLVLLGVMLATAGARAAPFVVVPRSATLRLDSAVAPDGQPVPLGASSDHRIDLGPIDRLGPSKGPGVIRTKDGTYVVTQLELEVVSGAHGGPARAVPRGRALGVHKPGIVDPPFEPLLSRWGFDRLETLFARLAEPPDAVEVWLAMGTGWDPHQAVRLSEVAQPVASGLLPGDTVPCAVSLFARRDQTGPGHAGVAFALR